MRSRTRNLIFGLTVNILILASLEILARIASTINQDVHAQDSTTSQWLAYSPSAGWERKPGFKGEVGYADREFDDAGYFTVDSEQVAAATEKKRIVFIGDSNTFGYGVQTTDSFVEVAERLLPDMDAINLGVVGYSSYQGRVTLEKYLPILDPDLIVVSFNFNDRRYVTPPEENDGPEQFERIYESSDGVLATITGYLEYSHLFRGLRRILRVAGAAPESAANVRVTDLKPRVDEDSYRGNLSFIAAEARRMGIPLVFILLRDDPLLSEHLRKGVASLAAQDYDMAIAYLNSAVRARTMFSELARVYLAKAYDARGDAEQLAASESTRSIYRSWSGGSVIRLDTDYNDIMRQVAAEYDVPLVDGAALLEEHPFVFIDFCHFNTYGHRLLGERLATRISEILDTQSTGGKDDARQNTRGAGPYELPDT